MFIGCSLRIMIFCTRQGPIMQHYLSYTVILLILHQCVAQVATDQVTDKNTKNAVEELLKKINEISVQSFSNAPHGSKLQLFRKIEAKLKKAVKYLGKKGERYVKLIMKGIKARALYRISDNNNTKIEVPTNIDDIDKFAEKNDITNDSLISKTLTELHGDPNKTDDLSKVPVNRYLNRENKTDYENINQNVHFVLNEHFRRMNSDRDGRPNRSSMLNRASSTEQLIQSFTPRYECEGSLDTICLNIKQMKELKCHFDDSAVPIEKLCDGVADCIDGTDEKFCTSQVTERIQNANQVIYQTDKYFQLGCFKNKTKDSIMTSQIIILRSVLQAQQEFVEKYKYFNRSLISNSEYLTGEDTVKRAVNEMSLIISSLALALDAELCAHRIKTGDEFIARKFNDLLIEDFDKVMDEVEWQPKSCVCKEERCENVTICTDACKRICWQKHSLTQWGCPSLNETENVPMSTICDGKFDCFDQSDEKDCVTGISFAKFQAHNIFKEILSLLSVKVASTEYAFIRNMLLSLHSIIEDLQRFCTASEPDLKMIRSLRNKCFFTISTIYLETLTKSSFLYQKSELYVFLMSLNEKIVNALKRSHTGNKRIISSDECFCTNGQCSMPACSKNCMRSCIAEPWLTRYLCENSSNKSVSLNAVCNGKPNCPREDDETHCEKEVCQRHHLTLLRQSIQNIGKKQEGTAMGELLATWKIKVSSTLVIAENNYRPNPNIIKHIVRDILNDLVITYGAVKDYRRDNEYALEEFIKIARHIMKFLKSCSY